MAAKAPKKIVIRAYNVGFGDCLLVSFVYTGAIRTRHVLIDCGSTRAPEAKKNNKDFMQEIVADITQVCGGKLDAIVATHRHRDHISGFGKETGPALAALKPDVVIQPWTEDPDAPEDELAPVNDPGTAGKFQAVAQFRRSLDDMHAMAGHVAAFARARRTTRPVLSKQLEFLGEGNVKNLEAVKNLMEMAPNKYVYFGSKHGLEKLLPGVKTLVLGPPTLKQTDTIRRQVDKNDDEFWHLYRGFTSFWSFQVATAEGSGRGRLFRGVKGRAPQPSERWLVDRLRKLQDDSILSIVTALDQQMNNTSVILLFETGGKRLLFPGDAQLENWLYALSALEKAGQISMIEKVDFYKVGHHGSLNATPMSLWNRFKKKGADGKLQTVLSTRGGVHGSTARSTEVPRRTLVAELEARTALQRTDTIKATDKELCKVIEISLS